MSTRLERQIKHAAKRLVDFELGGIAKSSTKERLPQMLNELVERGMTIDEAKDFIAGAIRMMNNEYGD